ncbi:MAG: hypothetical protein WCW63_01110 [Acholeplasmataceae bacterium]|jgi:hypothetical protein
MKKWLKWLFVFLGIAIPVLIVVLFTIFDVSKIWNTWGAQFDLETGAPLLDDFGKQIWIYPSFLEYIPLIIFKLSLYIIGPVIIAIGLTIQNKKGIQKKVYLYYLLTAINIWFLVILSAKLLSDSILELDKIFGLTLFSSIKDIQTLIGFILTVILKQTIEVKPNKVFEENLLKRDLN